MSVDVKPVAVAEVSEQLKQLLTLAAVAGESKAFVWTSFVKEGYHCFPEAGVLPEFKTGDEYDVSHLANKHMHYFHFKVYISVNHDNRDIEFIQLRRWLISLYDDNTLELNNKSCEMIARDLCLAIDTRWPGASIIVDVSEENISGAMVTYQRPMFS